MNARGLPLTHLGIYLHDEENRMVRVKSWRELSICADDVIDFFKETVKIFIKGRRNNAVELKIGN